MATLACLRELFEELSIVFDFMTVFSDYSNELYYRQQNLGFNFLIHPTTLCLLTGAFIPLTLSNYCRGVLCHISVGQWCVSRIDDLVLNIPFSFSGKKNGFESRKFLCCCLSVKFVLFLQIIMRA